MIFELIIKFMSQITKRVVFIYTTVKTITFKKIKTLNVEMAKPIFINNI